MQASWCAKSRATADCLIAKILSYTGSPWHLIIRSAMIWNDSGAEQKNTHPPVKFWLLRCPCSYLTKILGSWQSTSPYDYGNDASAHHHGPGGLNQLNPLAHRPSSCPTTLLENFDLSPSTPLPKDLGLPPSPTLLSKAWSFSLSPQLWDWDCGHWMKWSCECLA